MASSTDEIAMELPPLSIRLYKSGRVERGTGTDIVPASVDPTTKVHSKDIVINPVTSLASRIYLPEINKEREINNKKLPLLVYFHGGGFCIESAFSPLYHPFCNSLAMLASCVIVSVNYRLAPENPIPTAYEDSWEAVKWVISGNDTWLEEYADFDQIYFGGDSAGANIAHHLAIRVGVERVPKSGLAGVVLIHPYFWGKEAVKGEVTDANFRKFIDNLWLFVYPDTNGLGTDDPFLNPNTDPKHSDMCCERVLICLAEKDFLTPRGLDYYEKLEASEWKGKAEVWETKEENHIFHLLNPSSENAKDLIKRIALFLTNESP